MADIRIEIPFSGKFDTGPSGATGATGPGFYDVWREAASDLVRLTETRFVSCVHQYNQNLGYLCLHDFPDVVNSPTYTTVRQELIFFDSASRVRMYRMSESRLFIVRDDDVYIAEVSGDNIDIVKTAQNFFSAGTFLNLSTWGGTNSLGFPKDQVTFDAFPLAVDNELFVIENTIRLNNTLPVIKLWHVVYDPLTQTLTKTERFDFSTLEFSEFFRSAFRAKITRIPNTSNYFLSFSAFSRDPGSLTISQQNFAAPNVAMAARLSSNGTVLEQYPLPENDDDIGNPLTNCAVALSPDVVVFHNTAGTNIFSWERSSGTFTKALQMTFAQNTTAAVELYPIDQGHYFMLYNNSLTIRVLKYLNPLFITANSYFGNIGTTQARKSVINMWDPENVVIVNNVRFHQSPFNDSAVLEYYPHFYFSVLNQPQ